MAVPSSMNYINTDGFGGPEVLKIAQAPVPQPKTGEVLIRVMAAGINRADVTQRKGGYNPPPGASNVIGLEVAGEVAAIGDGVTTQKVGDRVCALVNSGGYAEYCAAPAPQCLPWPKGYDAVRAAAVPETYLTVWANLFAKGRFVRGTHLIHGGSSGIGLTAIQLVKEFGGTAYATAGSREKCDACIQYGAAGAINYREQDFVEAIRGLTGGKGVEVILDLVGAPYVQRNLSALAQGGKLVMIAFMEGNKTGEFNFGPVVVKHLTITGSTLRPRSVPQKGELVAEFREKVMPILDAGRCGPVIYRVLPLAKAGEAQALMETSQHIGKIMLKVAD